MQATQFLVLACLVASAVAFAPTTPALAGLKAPAMTSVTKMARVSRTAPKMSMAPLAEAASQSLLLAGEGMNVSVAAYLAVLLGTFVPVVFLVTLYIQSESRKAGSSD
mmetsp:Transcript_35723/g.87875  ORF Transcript_35723/g.87875 Transcript_35723/m.87875 type:complete len:108 (-) Transcript_35723:189-512(-)|eukprot:CAMPEP_0206228142 /NCGR_PEP_ID=MMETSP0047_2-20121206/9010_1 /ASSEMBLY_ACC=CAM_ASM_000192 /TAXON_ID=195065 /ORGANISM="Chroomonas mesostigmatica_cf, Strain CCMP1168" /LENGTH=107 /DNA_ID=CAMNT_0053651363 /DNA_START=19 /DNA_END=342 /DNA_ORIENTATION=+